MYFFKSMVLNKQLISFMMKQALSILLLGVLSMLFAEVFSGASTLWFVTSWGLLLTLPLYLGHVLFFFNVAVRTHRTSLRQLYFFGMMFGLYEALITKVLWFGYPNAAGPAVGYFFGVAWSEFLTLVLFWHPVMSFLVPILVYEVLSRDIIPGHEWLVQKNRLTLFAVAVLIITGAVFQSNGAKYNVLESVGSVAGTLLIVMLLHYLTPDKTRQSLVLGKKGMLLLVVYLVALYGASTAFILPERLPRTVIPYVLIFLWYVLAIGLLWVDRFTPKTMIVKPAVFSVRDLSIYVILLLGATVLFSLIPSVSYAILLVFFVSLMGAGIVIFSWSVLTLTKQRISLD
jgi:hypothetical protein